jgi:hypothetical protein
MAYEQKPGSTASIAAGGQYDDASVANSANYTNIASEGAAAAALAAATATTQAGIATTGAGTATTQAGIATTEANTATTQAGIATTGANTATTQASIATTQAGIATTEANTATTQAGIATTQASNALTSANNAAASYDSFDDRYLGAKSTVPTLDNDGNALLTGALYWDDNLSAMRAYNGTAWVTLPAATASTVSNTPSGNIAATNVQAAINELDAEKALLAGSAIQAFSASTFTGSGSGLTGTAAGLTSGGNALLAGSATQEFSASTFTGSGSGVTGLPIVGGTTGTLTVARGGTGAVTATAALVSLGNRTGATGSEILPVGTTAQRDVSPAAGYLRFNSDVNKPEVYSGSNWGSVGGGATGGGSDTIFNLNGQVVTTNYTIPSGSNASTVGPLSVPSGVAVTISSGSRWIIL